ncbi:hypothetical protein [Gemmobacter caeruleus]|uniref:hypothetical protein n=1 Tax=Gemmobacter caeruleus TaxID=2595004 RepID=UPI0011EF537A|nr:hypothetical protein [Gemmobacter caeruleus]
MQHDQPARGGLYVIAVRDFVLRADLTDTVREFDPQARILPAEGLVAALAQLSGADVPGVALIEAGPAALAAALGGAADPGAILLLGDAAEEEPAARWPVLIRPFSSDQVLTALTAAWRQTRP